jgi:hypothetical protein
VNVRFCPSCRSLILAEFRFCPYCGAAVKGPELSEALDGPFDSMGRDSAAGDSPAAKGDVFANAKTSVFAKAEESLERLEADMDLLLEELEKEGRSST